MHIIPYIAACYQTLKYVFCTVATCVDDIYGMEMKAFLQPEDVISFNGSLMKQKPRDESILKFCKVNDITDGPVCHQKQGSSSLDENSLKGKTALSLMKKTFVSFDLQD